MKEQCCAKTMQMLLWMIQINICMRLKTLMGHWLISTRDVALKGHLGSLVSGLFA